MERQVQLFIEGERVELFKDEKIILNSSVKDISDITKVLTDYSQSFSIPASNKNNKIFKHFYNSEVALVDGVYTNPQIRRGAVLEIDNTAFRRGVVALESSKLKMGKPYSYKITFYGELVGLKDIFGELMLAELNYESVAFTYDYANVKARIEDGATDYEVRFPLMTSDRYWQYDNPTTPNENIDTSQAPIVFTELFPALKFSSILRVIEETYGIEFNGNFLQDRRFTEMYLVYKKSKAFNITSQEIDFDIRELYEELVDNQGNPTSPIATAPFVYDYSPPNNEPGGVTIDSENDTIRFIYRQYDDGPGGQILSDVGYHKIYFVFGNYSPTQVTLFIDVYKNGQLYATIEEPPNSQSSFGEFVYEEENTNNPSLDTTLTFKVRASEQVSATFMWYQYEFQALIGASTGFGVWTEIDRFYINGPAPVQTSGELGLSGQAPPIKVADWFSHMLKLFNLTCYGTATNTFQLELLEDWYNLGKIVDITKYAHFDTLDVKRLQLLKNMHFKFTESQSLLNRRFAVDNLQEYGDLQASFNYDGGDYKVESIFENILASRFSDSNDVLNQLQAQYSLDENLEEYTSNGVIVYRANNEDCSFYLSDGTVNNVDEITSYVPFGAEVNLFAERYTLNWGQELSTLDNQQLPNSLYATYYKGYIDNLYNPKAREITLKATLPVGIITDLELNDRVVLRDKRYLIQNMKMDLTSGVTTFTLINDFRRIIADAVPPLERPIEVPPDVGCFNYGIPFIQGAQSATISECSVPSISGVTITPSVIYQAEVVEICLPNYTENINYISTEPVRTLLSTESANSPLITEDSVDGSRNIIICIRYDMMDGSVVENQIYIEQEPG